MPGLWPSPSLTKWHSWIWAFDPLASASWIGNNSVHHWGGKLKWLPLLVIWGICLFFFFLFYGNNQIAYEFLRERQIFSKDCTGHQGFRIGPVWLVGWMSQLNLGEDRVWLHSLPFCKSFWILSTCIPQILFSYTALGWLLKEGKDNRNRKERKREACGGNGGRRSEREEESQQGGRKEGWKAGWQGNYWGEKDAYFGSPPLEGSAAPGRNAIFSNQQFPFSLKRNHRLQKRKGWGKSWRKLVLKGVQ